MPRFLCCVQPSIRKTLKFNLQPKRPPGAPKHHRFAGFPLGRNLASVFPFPLGLFFRRFAGLQGGGGASKKEGRGAFTHIRLGTAVILLFLEKNSNILLSK